MLSIIFNSGEKIQMEKNTKIRGNREIFKAASNILAPNTGNILIYENDKEVDSIKYLISDLSTTKKWHQLNDPTNTYVIQIHSLYDETNKMFLITKIAIQKLIGKQNILLNI